MVLADMQVEAAGEHVERLGNLVVAVQRWCERAGRECPLGYHEGVASRRAVGFQGAGRAG